MVFFSKKLKDRKGDIEIQALNRDAELSLKESSSLMGFRKDLRKRTAKRMGVPVNSLVRVGTDDFGEFLPRSKVKKPIKGIFGNNVRL